MRVSCILKIKEGGVEKSNQSAWKYRDSHAKCATTPSKKGGEDSLNLFLGDAGNGELFVASLVTAQQSERRFRDFEEFGNEGCYLVISLAFDWRGGDGQLDRAIMQADYPGAG